MNINTLRKVLVTLGQILSYSVRHKCLDHNPLREAERPRDLREDEKEVRVLPPEQIRALLDTVPDQKYRTLFLMAVMTGARQGELLGLKWDDLDLENKRVHIQRTFNNGRFFPTKTKGSRRKIDLSPALLTQLKKWKLACPKTQLNLVFSREPVNPLTIETWYSVVSNRPWRKPGFPRSGSTICGTLTPACLSSRGKT